jgi:hypothetical protein
MLRRGFLSLAIVKATSYALPLLKVQTPRYIESYHSLLAPLYAFFYMIDLFSKDLI